MIEGTLRGGRVLSLAEFRRKNAGFDVGDMALVYGAGIVTGLIVAAAYRAFGRKKP